MEPSRRVIRTNDYAFKWLLGSPERKGLLLSFVNSVLSDGGDDDPIADERAWLEYERRERDLRDYAASLAAWKNKGIDIGREEGIGMGIDIGLEKAAQNMLKLGYSTDVIRGATQLSEEKISSLRATMS